MSNLIDFVGQVDKIHVEDDVMTLEISMASDMLSPEQLSHLIFICNQSVDIEITDKQTIWQQMSNGED